MKNFKIREHKLLTAVLINMIILLATILFCRPFLSPDDYLMARWTYGANTGVLDYHTIYENFIYGRIVVFFQQLFPSLPCYTVVFYCLLYLAFVMVTYEILQYMDTKVGIVISLTVLFFFSFEAYSAIQFTKVAGIIGGAGVLLLLLRKSSKIQKICGLVLIFFSCLIRVNVVHMIIGAWATALLVIFIRVILTKDKKALRGYLGVACSFLLVIIVYALVPFIPKYESEEERQLWIDYWTWNKYRSDIQDYPYPDYEQNIDIYEAIDVSANDLFIWHEWNTDAEILSGAKGKAIVALYDKNTGIVTRIFNLENILGFLKIIPVHLLKIDVYLCYLALLFGVTFSSGWKKKINLVWAMLASIIPLLAINYYLYISQRYFQHRVDVAIFFNIICIFIYYILENESEIYYEKKVAVRSLGTALMIYMLIDYGLWADDKPLCDEQDMRINKEFYENTYRDEEHIYVIGNKRQNIMARDDCFYALEVFPKGFYSNIIRGYDVYMKELYQKQNGIGTSPYIDVVDNEQMYFVLASDDGNQQEWEEYIGKHSGKNVSLVLVKEYLNRKIYRVVSDDVSSQMASQGYKNGDETKVNCDIEASLDGQQLQVDGNISISGTNSFTQNVYIVIKDVQTETEVIYYALQNIYKENMGNDEQKFSGITARVDLPATYESNDEIFIIVENEGCRYKTKVTVE